MEIGIIGIIVAIIIALIPYIRSKYFLGPKLTLEITKEGGRSTNEGLSAMNDTSKGYVDGNTAIYIFGLTWKFSLILRNSSDHNAFFPKFHFIPSRPRFTKMDQINSLKPIKTGDELVIEAEYSIFEEAQVKERTKIKGFPPEIEDLKILIEYQNSKERKFYTLFDNSTSNKNSFLKRRPKEFKN